MAFYSPEFVVKRKLNKIIPDYSIWLKCDSNHIFHISEIYTFCEITVQFYKLNNWNVIKFNFAKTVLVKKPNGKMTLFD